MINEFDKVKIKSSGILGVVVDIYHVNGGTTYTVESDEDNSLHYCGLDELEKV